MGVSFAMRRRRAACLSLLSLAGLAGFAPARAFAAEIFGPPTNTAQNTAFGQVVNPTVSGDHSATSHNAAPATAAITVLSSADTPFGANGFAIFGGGDSHPQGRPGAPHATGLSVEVSGASTNPIVDAAGGHSTTLVVTGRAEMNDVLTVHAGQGLHDGDVVTLHEIMSLAGAPPQVAFSIGSNVSAYSGAVDLTFGSSTGAFGGVAGDTTIRVGGAFKDRFDPVIQIDPTATVAPTTLEFTQDFVIGQAISMVWGLQLLETLIGDDLTTLTSGVEARANFDLGFDGTGFLTRPGQSGDAPALRITSASGFDFLSNDIHPGDGVPEPAAWALMVTGFAGLGTALRANRRARAA